MLTMTAGLPNAVHCMGWWPWTELNCCLDHRSFLQNISVLSILELSIIDFFSLSSGHNWCKILIEHLLNASPYAWNTNTHAPCTMGGQSACWQRCDLFPQVISVWPCPQLKAAKLIQTKGKMQEQCKGKKKCKPTNFSGWIFYKYLTVF